MTERQSNKKQPDGEGTVIPDDLKPTTGDYALIGAKALASVVPLVGGPITELLDLITPPLEKRRDAFMLEVAAEVQRLKEEGVNVERLFKDEAFISTLLHAAQVAIRNHQQEKLQALRNAIRNSALPEAPSADLRLMFISFVDTFTPWHLRALQFYRVKRKHKFSFREFLANSGQAPNPPLVRSFPQLGEQKPFADQVVRDLLNHGLLSSNSGVSVTTPFGRQFLDFISST